MVAPQLLKSLGLNHSPGNLHLVNGAPDANERAPTEADGRHQRPGECISFAPRCSMAAELTFSFDLAPQQ